MPTKYDAHIRQISEVKLRQPVATVNVNTETTSPGTMLIQKVDSVLDWS